MLHTLISSHLLILSSQKHLGKDINVKASNYVIVSNHLPFHPGSIQEFSSAPLSKTLSTRFKIPIYFEKKGKLFSANFNVVNGVIIKCFLCDSVFQLTNTRYKKKSFNFGNRFRERAISKFKILKRRKTCLNLK